MDDMNFPVRHSGRDCRNQVCRDANRYEWHALPE